MSRKSGKRDTSQNEHSIPRVAVQVPDIGYCIPGIQWFCNNANHQDCLGRLEQAFRDGGFVVRTSYWFPRYEALAKARREANEQNTE